MPYIRKEDRQLLDSHQPKNVGQLNFRLTSLIHNYILSKEELLTYSRVNEVIGVLECAKLELYRMVAAPYENAKKLENGNISELDK